MINPWDKEVQHHPTESKMKKINIYQLLLLIQIIVSHKPNFMTSKTCISNISLVQHGFVFYFSLIPNMPSLKWYILHQSKGLQLSYIFTVGKMKDTTMCTQLMLWQNQAILNFHPSTWCLVSTIYPWHSLYTLISGLMYQTSNRISRIQKLIKCSTMQSKDWIHTSIGM